MLFTGLGEKAFIRAMIVTIFNGTISLIRANWRLQTATLLNVLQELGGCSDYKMVVRYAHLAPEHLAKHAANVVTILGTVAEKKVVKLR